MSYLYPYGDTQQLNLSWFLAKFKELYEYITNLDPDDIAITTVLSRFTNEYNSSTNYIPGDYVIHEGYIYKANQSTTGNFNPEAWDAALPVNDIQGLRILLGGISRNLTDLEENAVTNMQYTSGAADADGLLRQTKNGTAETVMTVDKEPTENSQNPVKSGAVQTGIAAVSQAVGSERTDRQNADTSLQNQIDDLNDITGDGSLTGFTATDLTGAANELKGFLNANESAIAIVANGNTHASIASGQYVYIKNHASLAEGLYKAVAAIPLNGTISTSNVTAVSNGGLNNIHNDLLKPNYRDNITISYVENEYVSQNNVIITPFRQGDLIILFINLQAVNNIPQATEVVIAKINNYSASIAFKHTLVSQWGKGALYFEVATNGNIVIGNYSGTSVGDTYRNCFPIVTNQ